MPSLKYTVQTDSGRALDISFPLHPATGSEKQVAGLLTSMLAAATATIASEDTMSNGDVMQAFAMAYAIRMRMASESPQTMATVSAGTDADALAVRQLGFDLLQTACDSVASARNYPSGRS